MSDSVDAWEAWAHTRRALRNTLPWTADWLRLRMVEQDRRASYIRLLREESSVGPDPLAGGGVPGSQGRGPVPRPLPKRRDGAGS